MLIPGVRLIMPPAPFADPVMPQVAATSAETTVIHWTVGPQTVDAGSSALSYSWGPFDLMSLAFGAWVDGMIEVLVAALMNSEERSGGKAWVSTCGSGLLPYP